MKKILIMINKKSELKYLLFYIYTLVMEEKKYCIV